MLYEEEKVWGSVTHLFQSNKAAISLLDVKAGFCCSRHYHKFRVNQFTSLSCVVAIQWWMDNMPPIETVIHPGETYVVLAGIVHRFRVLKDGELLEVYWPKDSESVISIDDIVRLDEGGKYVDA